MNIKIYQDDTTFLLLDLRENDDFNKFNIKECKIIITFNKLYFIF